jgi:branched-chain amino acid transport system permease protein
MDTFLQNCLNGLSIGSIYALIAIGYTMVYGILRLINFAHGDIFMMAGYFMIICMTDLLIPWYISIIIVIIATIILGVVIEKVAYKPLRDAPRMSIMISAIGVSYLLENLATYIFSAQPKSYPYDKMGFLSSKVTLGNISTTLVTFITPVLTILLVIALVILIRKTKIGMAMRAVSRDFETSQLMGVRINAVISFTFVIGSGLAALGSVLYFIPRASVYPLAGSLPGLKCFVAAVFGGIGSIPGALVGGFLIGLSETFVKGSATLSQYSDVITFVLLIIVLLVKPTGLFGEKIKEKV